MQLVEGGPAIPQEVLVAHEAGRLAMICGAGISLQSGLPTFARLVKKVREVLGCDHDDVQKAVDAQAYDRALELLERLHFERPSVRTHVQKILTVKAGANTETHKALLDLSRTADGRLQLVTTNFDRLFEIAGFDAQSYRAPALPVPKPTLWNGLVYLHGAMGPLDPGGEHLVMTTADFGRAYLVDGWASRFVSALFANYTVLFVGYGVNDPVMRYLVDAIAADRFLDVGFGEAFAFVGLDEEADQEATQAEWAGKHVTPISYRASGNDHSMLHDTLRAWAALHSGGLDSRRNVVNEFGPMDPSGLGQESKSRLLWAIEDADVANHFAEMGADSSFGWADVLGERLTAAAIDPGQKTRFVGWSPEGRTLSISSKALARWLASHVADPELAKWVVSKGSYLHPEFASIVQSKLDSPIEDSGIEPGSGLDHFWSALLRGDIRDIGALYDPDNFKLKRRLADESWSPKLRCDTLRAFRPGLVFNRSLSGLFRSLPDEPSEADASCIPLSDLASVDVKLNARTVGHDMVEAIESREDAHIVLADLSVDAASALRQAVELLASVGLAGRDYDFSLAERPSIAPHEQNRSSNEWTALVDLNRLAFEALLRSDRLRAERLVVLWKEIDYPVFRRLVLHAARLLLASDEG